MLKQEFLFASPLYSTIIQPDSYQKQEIIDTVLYNYSIDNNRNKWDDDSNLHHSYNDWNNEKFKEVDTTSLIDIYKNIIDSFLASQNFRKKIKYKWAIENITAYNNSQFMREHDHLLENVIWTCVHYISVPKNASPLTFHNPLTFQSYGQHPGVKVLSDFVNTDNPLNSTYFHTFNYRIKEDEFLIFPSFLRHSVMPNPTLDGLRIAVVVNINFVEFADK